MQTIRHLATLRTAVAALKQNQKRIAFVATMGALHAGHMALIEQAQQMCDAVIVSIFINPKQFAPGEDLSRYPRQEEADAAMLEAAGVAILWLPSVDEMYPAGFATTISVAHLGEGLCGAARPGHFDGVATVVAKLLTQTTPDVAIFGEKDWQQLAVIRRMAIDLNLPVEIVGVPSQRDADGLALSSRNAYLSDAERLAALALSRSLQHAGRDIEAGGTISAILSVVGADLVAAGFAEPDYVALVDAATLQPLETLDVEARILAAARIGTTRLIDNFAVTPPSPKRK